jgi:hypothetical protein
MVTAGLETVSLGVRFRSCRAALKGVLAHFWCRLAAGCERTIAIERYDDGSRAGNRDQKTCNVP